MDAMCFLSLYEEHVSESGMSLAAPNGTESSTATKETPDRDIGFAAGATETFSKAQREEPDQDQGTTQYMGIPRHAERQLHEAAG